MEMGVPTTLVLILHDADMMRRWSVHSDLNGMTGLAMSGTASIWGQVVLQLAGNPCWTKCVRVLRCVYDDHTKLSMCRCELLSCAAAMYRRKFDLDVGLLRSEKSTNDDNACTGAPMFVFVYRSSRHCASCKSSMDVHNLSKLDACYLTTPIRSTTFHKAGTILLSRLQA